MPSVGFADSYQFELLAGTTATAITVPSGQYGLYPHFWAISAYNQQFRPGPTLTFHFSNGDWVAPDFTGPWPQSSGSSVVFTDNSGNPALPNWDDGFTITITMPTDDWSLYLSSLGYTFRGLVVFSLITVSTVPASDIAIGYGQGLYEPFVGYGYPDAGDPATLTERRPLTVFNGYDALGNEIETAVPYKSVGVETAILVISPVPTDQGLHQIHGEDFDAITDWSGTVDALRVSEAMEVTVPESIWSSWPDVQGGGKSPAGIVSFDGWLPGDPTVVYPGGHLVRADTFLEMSDDGGASWQTANSFTSISNNVTSGQAGTTGLHVGYNTQQLVARTNVLQFRITNATAIVTHAVSWTNLSLQLFSLVIVTDVIPPSQPVWDASGFASGSNYLSVVTQFTHNPLIGGVAGDLQLACTLGLWTVADPDAAPFTIEPDGTSVTLSNYTLNLPPAQAALEQSGSLIVGYAWAVAIVTDDPTAAVVQASRRGRAWARVIR